MKKTILVAAHEIGGATVAKDGARTPWTIPAGEQITAALAKSRGLDKDEVGLLRAKGAINEVVARADAGEDRDEALAVMTERAEKAEARLAELEKDLADAKTDKPGKA